MMRGEAGLNEDKNLRIPWGHVRTIHRKIKDVDVALFYMSAYTENGNHPAPAGHPSTGGELNSPPVEGWQAKPDGVVIGESHRVWLARLQVVPL